MRSLIWFAQSRPRINNTCLYFSIPSTGGVTGLPPGLRTIYHKNKLLFDLGVQLQQSYCQYLNLWLCYSYEYLHLVPYKSQLMRNVNHLMMMRCLQDNFEYHKIKRTVDLHFQNLNISIFIFFKQCLDHFISWMRCTYHNIFHYEVLLLFIKRIDYVSFSNYIMIFTQVVKFYSTSLKKWYILQNFVKELGIRSRSINMELKSLTQGFYIWVVDSGLKYDFIKFVSIFMLLVRGIMCSKCFTKL